MHFDQSGLAVENDLDPSHNMKNADLMIRSFDYSPLRSRDWEYI